jgi:hypothetical protein
MKLVNKTGYLKGAKTAKNPVNIIPSSLITTQGMAFPIKANGKTLYPNTGQYKFPTSPVVETPLKNKFQEGTEELVPDKRSKMNEKSLSKAQEIAYQRWRKSKNLNESDDYDLREYWKNVGYKNIGATDNSAHLTDPYKRLAPFSEGDNYPTLSDESNRASKFDKRGQGTWVGEGDSAKYVNYQKGTKSTKANPIPTPSLGTGIVKDIQKTINSSAFKQQVKKQKEEKKLKLINNRKKAYTPSSGNVGMTAGPIDAAIAGVAGIPGLVGKGLTTALPYVQGALNAPLTTAVPGVTAGNILGSVNAADAVVNRLPKIPGQLKNKEYSAAAGNALIAGLDILGAKYAATNTIKEGKSLYDVNKVIPKPTSLTNKTENPLIYKDPNTGKTIYEIDPADYDNFSTPELKQQALKDLEIGKKDWYKYQNKEQQKVVTEAQKIITPKQPLLKKENFYTNSQVNQIIKNNKEYDKISKEFNEINPNITSEDDINNILLSRPDLEKRWMEMAKEGKSFKENMLTPSQEKYVRKNVDSYNHQLDFRNMLSKQNLKSFEKGLTKQPLTSKQIERYKQQEGIDPANPFYGYTGGYTKEGIHPSPENLKKVKFPINFGIGSMNKDGNKNVKSNLVKYKKGSKGVSLAFSRGEKDPKGGLTQKGVNKYNRATGGNLKMAVTTPPSKLKAGSKPAKRRASFCSRMSGVKGPMTKPNGKPTRKALALRKWNC